MKIFTAYVHIANVDEKVLIADSAAPVGLLVNLQAYPDNIKMAICAC